MATQKILMPYNFTANEKKALDFIINTFAHRRDVKVTLFNTYAPLPKIDMEKEAGLKSIMDYLLEKGFSEDQIDYIFKQRERTIVEEIISIVSKGHYGVLVLSRQSGKATRLFARSLHSKVLHALKDITICIAT
jgi:hypothetical protein